MCVRDTKPFITKHPPYSFYETHIERIGRPRKLSNEFDQLWLPRVTVPHYAQRLAESTTVGRLFDEIKRARLRVSRSD